MTRIQFRRLDGILLLDKSTGMSSNAALQVARRLFRAEKGVVGRIGSCSSGWCAFDVKGQKGFVKASDVWGATSG